MLPFLKRKNTAGLIVSMRKPDGGKEELHSEGNENDDLESCCEALIRAVHAKDAQALASAFREAVEAVKSPSAQEEEASPHTYDAQNIKAAQEE